MVGIPNPVVFFLVLFLYLIVVFTYEIIIITIIITIIIIIIIIIIIFICMFLSFFNALERSRYLSFFSHSFSFILWSAGTAKSIILQVLFFLLIINRSGLLLYVVCRSPIGVYVCYFLGQVLSCAYTISSYGQI